jgi:hypothetical protein
MRLFMADITQEDEWVMEKGIVAKMYMTPRQIKSYREGRWIEGFIIRSTPDPKASEGRVTLLYNYTRINRLVGET